MDHSAHSCPHASLRFCGHCNKVWCLTCKVEWGPTWLYDWNRTWPYYIGPYTTSPTISYQNTPATTGTTMDVNATHTCGAA